MDDKKQKLQQQMELLKKKMRALEYAENEKLRKQRNEKIFNTGAIFDMVNPELLLQKILKLIHIMNLKIKHIANW